jgi:uncharacterized protein (TIGR02246 family)
MDTAELVAREAIRDLVARYAQGADRGRFDEVAALFAPDGVLELPDGTKAIGRDVIRSFLGATGESLGKMAAVPWIRHHVTTHRIVVEDRDRASGHAYFFVMTERGPDHWGRYTDRYVRDGEVWLFAGRRVRLDGYAPGSVAAERRAGRS